MADFCTHVLRRHCMYVRPYIHTYTVHDYGLINYWRSSRFIPSGLVVWLGRAGWVTPNFLALIGVRSPYSVHSAAAALCTEYVVTVVSGDGLRVQSTHFDNAVGQPIGVKS